MRHRQEHFRERGAEVLVISFDGARRVRGYCRRLSVPFCCLTDEQRVAYQAYGLGRASWFRMLRPRALAPYLKLYLRRGPGPRLTYTGQDLRQMGGDFVITADGVLALAYASHDPADRPTVDDLLAALARPPADD